MNRNQREALEASQLDMELTKRRAVARARQLAGAHYGEATSGTDEPNPNTCTIHRRSAGDLEAIMARRTLNNYAVERLYKETIEQLQEASEEDAIRIHRLEEAYGVSESAMKIIREQLRFMPAEWGPLLDALFQRQAALEATIEEIVCLPAKCQSNELQALIGKLLRTLRNEPEPEPEEPLYYCPTCKRHVHPEDLVWTEDETDGNGYRHTHHDAEGKLLGACPGFVEVRAANKPQRQEAYLAAVDAALAQLGATRNADDAEAIEECREEGTPPETCAEFLYDKALSAQRTDKPSGEWTSNAAVNNAPDTTYRTLHGDELLKPCDEMELDGQWIPVGERTGIVGVSNEGRFRRPMNWGL